MNDMIMERTAQADQAARKGLISRQCWCTRTCARPTAISSRSTACRCRSTRAR
ncbi:hypothetical protein WJ968_22315 [Achromobacter xylosoxidans]